MPRQPRLDAPGTLHHVMSRGIDRAKIFRKEEEEDFQGTAVVLSAGAEIEGYPEARVASFFGVTTSTVIRVANFQGLLKIENYSYVD